jgi:hypothetical protein
MPFVKDVLTPGPPTEQRLLSHSTGTEGAVRFADYSAPPSILRCRGDEWRFLLLTPPQRVPRLNLLKGLCGVVLPCD